MLGSCPTQEERESGIIITLVSLLAAGRSGVLGPTTRRARSPACLRGRDPFLHKYTGGHSLLHGCHRLNIAKRGVRNARGGRLGELPLFSQARRRLSGGVSLLGCAGAAVTDVDQCLTDEDQLAHRAITSVAERLALA